MTSAWPSPLTLTTAASPSFRVTSISIVSILSGRRVSTASRRIRRAPCTQRLYRHERSVSRIKRRFEDGTKPGAGTFERRASCDLLHAHVASELERAPLDRDLRLAAVVGEANGHKLDRSRRRGEGERELGDVAFLDRRLAPHAGLRAEAEMPFFVGDVLGPERVLAGLDRRPGDVEVARRLDLGRVVFAESPHESDRRLGDEVAP